MRAVRNLRFLASLLQSFPHFLVVGSIASRGISRETLEMFGVGYYSNPKSKSSINNRILIPIHNAAGELLAFAARTTENDGARYWFPPIEKFDGSLELWNFHRAAEEKDVIILEGFFGCMNIHQHGYPCVVALMGSNMSDHQAELIAEHFQSAKFLIDPDEAGRKLARRAMEALHGRILLKLIFPPIQADQMTAKEMAQYLGKPLE